MIVHAEADSSNPRHTSLRENIRALHAAVADGDRSIRLIPLPLPDPVSFDGKELPASYCNFYFTNQSVIVPQFGVRQDAEAIGILQSLLSDRKVIGLRSNHLSVGLGSFHCLTQQQPAVT